MPSERSPSPGLKHELRTPLNHIIGFCEMLIEESEDDASPAAEQEEWLLDLRRIHAAGQRLLGVINELFDESIPVSERLDESRIHHEVRTPLNQIIGYAEMLHEDAVTREHPSMAGDLEKIRQAAHQLLGLMMANFGAADPRAGLSAKPEPSVNILHKDNDDATTRTTHGTGSILITDDDATNREMLARRLERLGHAVSTAAGGSEALEMIRTGSYDLLLLDVVMPGMSGHEVLAHLQVNPPPSSLPVIVLSASDDSGQVARCIEEGAEDYLPKPFDPALLQARIDSCLEKKRLRDREVMYLRMIEKERERADDLLHVILPANVAAELKATQEFRPRRVDNVAILFADVVGFTSYCEKRDPEVIYRELQSLVKELEVLTGTHGMEKIKTIGDAFLSAAGLLNQFGNPALDCVRCGLAMIEMAKRLPVPWNLRVGVHVGPVVAGIVGRQRYQFDVWGDTVNSAARMQAEARPGSLCVTGKTWQLLEDHCEGGSVGIREIKGKGSHEIFEVTKVKSRESPR